MKVLITGATGLIGRATMLRLLAEGGHIITAVSRDPKRAANQLGAEVDIVGWDDSVRLRSALNDSDLVLHLAGEPVAPGRRFLRRRAGARAPRAGHKVTGHLQAAVAARKQKKTDDVVESICDAKNFRVYKMIPPTMEKG